MRTVLKVVKGGDSPRIDMTILMEWHNIEMTGHAVSVGARLPAVIPLADGDLKRLLDIIRWHRKNLFTENTRCSDLAPHPGHLVLRHL